MGRPIKLRNVTSYQHDVELLSRLRAAMLLDRALDSTQAKRAIAAIDELVDALIPLITQVDLAERSE